jgi:hypothetical protein
MSADERARAPRMVPVTMPTIAAAVAVLLLAAAIGGAASVPVSGWTESEPWESSEQAEGAVHRAVEQMAEEGLLAEGDEFRVVEIRGTVGPHNSPWHITYTAVIEQVGGG